MWFLLIEACGEALILTLEAPVFLGGLMTIRLVVMVLGVALAVSGCASLQETSDGVPASGAPVSALTERPTELTREMLIGRWGVASFREEKDRARATAQARSFCTRQPYEITAGPRNGVMMHAADDPKLYELRLKGASDGKTYLGFEAPPGDWQDRVILSASNDQLVMRFVDPEIHNRYGTFIYVRCK